MNRRWDLLLFVTAGLLFVIVGKAGANSCSNVVTHGSFDRSGIDENDYGIYAAGTFRIEDEKDESRQPFFNLTSIDCAKQRGLNGALNLTCRVTRASMYGEAGEPDAKRPNCALDLDISEYTMKEAGRGILTGTAGSGICYHSILSIDRNSNRVYLSFTKTKEAYDPAIVKANMCSGIPRTQVLMNCTPWSGLRKKINSSSRYCDFSRSKEK